MGKTYAGLNRLLVKLEELPSTGAILSVASDVFAYGKIAAVGSLKDMDGIKEGQFQEGDGVYFLAQAGVNIELPEGTFRIIAVTDVQVGVKGE